MSGRPCNPGSDFESLWQIFLRDMLMPQCKAPPDPQPAPDSKAAKAAPSPSDPAPDEPGANPTRGR